MIKPFVATVLFAFVSVSGAETKGMPVWLTPYPGARTEPANAPETSYEVAAKPEEVIAHYRKLLTSQALPFIPNFDGMGVSVRAAAPECDLLLKIRESDAGTQVRVSCTVRTAGSNSSLYGEDVGIASPEPPPPPPAEKPEGASTEGQKPGADPEPQKAAPEPPKKEPAQVVRLRNS